MTFVIMICHKKLRWKCKYHIHITIIREQLTSISFTVNWTKIKRQVFLDEKICGGDFAKISGLLRIYELYQREKISFIGTRCSLFKIRKIHFFIDQAKTDCPSIWHVDNMIIGTPFLKGYLTWNQIQTGKFCPQRLEIKH